MTTTSCSRPTSRIRTRSTRTPTDHFLDLLPDLISEESKAKILWDNAVDFYRFPDGYLPTDLHRSERRRQSR